MVTFNHVQIYIECVYCQFLIFICTKTQHSKNTSYYFLKSIKIGLLIKKMRKWIQVKALHKEHICIPHGLG